MSRTSATFSVSLPPAMARELERVRKHEHRTRSELVREALRHYMARSDDAREMRQRIAVLPEEKATAEEIEAIEETRRAFRDGNFVTLDHVRHGNGSSSSAIAREKISGAFPPLTARGYLRQSTRCAPIRSRATWSS